MNEEIYVCKDCLSMGDVIEMRWSNWLQRYTCPDCHSEHAQGVVIDGMGDIVQDSMEL